MEMIETPKVYCKKDGVKVPIWFWIEAPSANTECLVWGHQNPIRYCLGSFIQQRRVCDEFESLKVEGDNVTVKCSGGKQDE